MKWEHVLDIIPLLDVCFLFNSQSEGDVPYPLNTTGVLPENIVPVDRSIKAVITQLPGPCILHLVLIFFQWIDNKPFDRSLKQLLSRPCMTMY